MAKKKMTLEEKLEDAIVKDVPYDVPDNWIWVKFGAVCKLRNGYAFKSTQYKEIGVPILRISNIQEFGINIDKRTVYSEYDEKLDRYCVNKGDLLIAMSGATTGKTGVYNENEKSYLNQRVGNIKIEHQQLITDKFRNYIVSYKGKEILDLAYGGAQPNISTSMIEGLSIPLPPLNEQQRIVYKIENLFEKLDKAKELIEEAREDFEKRKSAILEKAFRGELTKEWGRKNNIIRSKERSKLGDIVKINPKRDKLIDIDDNKECTFVPMISVSEIKGVVEKPLVEKYSKVKNGYTYFKENDVIFAKITPCMENGKSAIVTNLIDGFGFGSSEFHVIRCNENILNKFIYHLVRSKFFRDIASQHMTGAVGQRRVPKKFLEEFEIVLPMLQEQKEIVKILDKILEDESKIEELTQLEEQIELIKKSILAKAFRGQLGTNCKGDESALELLKEILNT